MFRWLTQSFIFFRAFVRAMESMQASMETEQKAKAEALRIKKKLEGDINEFEIALDHANKANNEALKSIKRYQGQLREAEVSYEEAARLRQEMSERASLADRRANALQGEMEEARSLLDSAERGKRQTEAELNEARAAVNEMTTINTRAGAEKRSLEAAVHTMQAEIDDMLHQAKNSEEKAKKAMVDAARLADELRAEQDHVNTQSKAKHAMEVQLGELESKLAEATDAANRAGQDRREPEGSPEGGAQDQGALLPDRGGQEEPGQDDRARRQAAAEDQDLQEADRGGGGDRRPQPGQVQEGSAGA